MTNAIEIIKGSMEMCVSLAFWITCIFDALNADKLYMGFHDEDYPPSKTSPQYTLFLNDKSLVFTSFFADFGPLDLGLTHKFCSQLHDTITKSSDKNKPVLYSCSSHAHHRSNGAVLICAYMVRGLQCLNDYVCIDGLLEPSQPPVLNSYTRRPCCCRSSCTTARPSAPTDPSWVGLL